MAVHGPVSEIYSRPSFCPPYFTIPYLFVTKCPPLNIEKNDAIVFRFETVYHPCRHFPSRGIDDILIAANILTRL